MKKGKNKNKRKQKFLLLDDASIGLFKLKKDAKKVYHKYKKKKKR